MPRFLPMGKIKAIPMGNLPIGKPLMESLDG